jgi:hypothetical protein
MLPFVVELLKGESVSFMVNGTFYPHYRWNLPPWSCFVQTTHEPQNKKQQHFTQMQGAQKDVEKTFGVLQGRWAIFQNPC